jgi:folylpolyglutamate synthase/dihydropteroate synthase
MSSTHGITVTPAQVEKGLETVRWPGRLEPVHGSDGRRVALLIDSAHNPDAVREVVASVRELLAHAGLSRVVVLFGAMSDKNWAGMIELVPREWPAVHTAVTEARAEDPERLLAEARRQGRTQDTAVSTPPAALRLARARAGRDGLVLVLGSLYLAGAMRQALQLS